MQSFILFRPKFHKILCEKIATVNGRPSHKIDIEL